MQRGAGTDRTEDQGQTRGAEPPPERRWFQACRRSHSNCRSEPTTPAQLGPLPEQPRPDGPAPAGRSCRQRLRNTPGLPPLASGAWIGLRPPALHRPPQPGRWPAPPRQRRRASGPAPRGRPGPPGPLLATEPCRQGHGRHAAENQPAPPRPAEPTPAAAPRAPPAQSHPDRRRAALRPSARRGAWSWRGEHKPVDSAWPTIPAPSTATHAPSAATPAPAAGSRYNLRTIIIQQTLGLAGLSL